METEAAEGREESETETTETNKEPPFEVPKTEAVNVGDLWYGMLDVGSVDYDWTEHEVGDAWEFWEIGSCNQCGAENVGSWQECPKCHDTPGAEGPMMGYYYPMSGLGHGTTPEDAARRISDLPLCIVKVGETYGLALTGGGMDLSWEICEAFIRLGHLPPTHFAELPKVAGRGRSRRDRVIARACIRSFDACRGRDIDGAKRVREMLAWAKGRGEQ